MSFLDPNAIRRLDADLRSALYQGDMTGPEGCAITAVELNLPKDTQPCHVARAAADAAEAIAERTPEIWRCYAIYAPDDFPHLSEAYFWMGYCRQSSPLHPVTADRLTDHDQHFAVWRHGQARTPTRFWTYQIAAVADDELRRRLTKLRFCQWGSVSEFLSKLSPAPTTATLERHYMKMLSDSHRKIFFSHLKP